MKSSSLPLVGLSLLPIAYAFDCTPSAFSAILPANATVVSATKVAQGATFTVPKRDIAYPTAPSKLNAACAVEINVTSSSTSAYGFGIFLPDNWNDRFL